MAHRSTDNSDQPVLLALSGGGYRAMLFHVGSLWKLNEIGELSHLAHVSSVSGGSISSGVLAANWGKLTFNDLIASNFREQIAEPLMKLASLTLDIPAGLSGLLPFYPASRTIEFFYRKYLFGDTLLRDLPTCPRFTFNATNMQTGAVWTFERDVMGDQTVGTRSSTEFPLARAVAASSAFPPFLAPVVIRDHAIDWRSQHKKYSVLRSYDDLAIRAPDIPSDQVDRFRRRIVLVDGGVADNLGSIATWSGAGDLYISDGGAAIRPTLRPRQDWLSQLLRLVSLIHEQPSQLRANRAKAEMADRDEGGSKTRSPRRTGDGAVWNMHWPPESHQDTEFPQRKPADWSDLAAVPTRLKAIPPKLQKRLINWGYIACNRSLPYVDRLFRVGGFRAAFKEDGLPFPDAATETTVDA